MNAAPSRSFEYFNLGNNRELGQEPSIIDYLGRGIAPQFLKSGGKSHVAEFEMMPVGFSVGGHVGQPGFPAGGVSQGPGIVDLFQQSAAVLEQPIESYPVRQGRVVKKYVDIFPVPA
jgi:hypothetical protein